MKNLRHLLLSLSLLGLVLTSCVTIDQHSTAAVGASAAPASSAQAANTTPIIDYRERFLPIVAQHGMVAGPEQLAAEVGAQILREGGNAVDAAVATGFALAVTYPRAGNLGGGGFMLIHLADENRQTLIDYRETAPAAATRDMFLDAQGKLDHDKEYFSLQAAGVPGTVAGLLYALEKYGTLSREQVLAPAIALAAQGLTVSFGLNYEINASARAVAQKSRRRTVVFSRGRFPLRHGRHLETARSRVDTGRNQGPR